MTVDYLLNVDSVTAVELESLLQLQELDQMLVDEALSCIASDTPYSETWKHNSEQYVHNVDN